jgi:choline dehydrogenase
MIFYDLRPTSRGAVQIASSDPATPPRIRMNYLATQRDRQVLREGVRLTRRIVAMPAFAGCNPQETWPGAAAQDDAALDAAIADKATTIFHPVGSARMGLATDPQAVVDAELRVIGAQGLSVIDASVMPSIVSGNTATPTLMVAEKGAALLLATRD